MLNGVVPPWFFVSVASKGLRNPVSLLESTVTVSRGRVSVAFNRVRRIPIGLREMTPEEGREDAWTTCGR
jgi:hypothetical protein